MFSAGTEQHKLAAIILQGGMDMGGDSALDQRPVVCAENERPITSDRMSRVQYRMQLPMCITSLYILIPVIAEAAGFVVDHQSVALFDQIPPAYLAAARDLRVLFSDRSVGQNINEALDCLAAPSWAQSPAACRRDYYTNWLWKTLTQADRNAGLVPARILFDPDPVTYSRTNWTFEFRSGSWSELTQGDSGSQVSGFWIRMSSWR